MIIILCLAFVVVVGLTVAVFYQFRDNSDVDGGRGAFRDKRR